MKYVYTALFLGIGTTLLVAEPSVYGNNNGGFYASEKAISKNKATIVSLKRKITQQNEQIDGLRSIVEGLSASVNKLQQKGNTNTQETDSALLKELGGMIDKINNEYVSKSELEKALANKSGYVVGTKQSLKKPVGKGTESLKGKSTKELYSEGVRLFVKKRYDEAQKRFSITDTKGHKPAASNYYLGEISYYTKKYEDAIFYYKKSAGLYDKASYIDTLLLHTAISLEKNGEKEQARAFYENIIGNYADKKTASIAKQKLKKL